MSPKPVAETLADVEETGRITFHIRGKQYEVEEAEATGYEEDARTATNEEEGTTDMTLLTKLLTLRTVKVDGVPLDAVAWGKEKFPVVNRVQNEVRRLHYIELETDEEIEERRKREAKSTADAKKAKSPEGPDLPNS